MVNTKANDADPPQEPAAEDRRLVVRLKIPLKVKNNQIIVYTGERACKICGKVLKNGKAVGGHMRIHNKKPKNQDKDYTEKAPKKKRVYKSSWSGDNGTNASANCAVCGKRFPAVKSLYGHMKAHPNRGWRGITPPSSSSSLSELQMVNFDEGEKNKSVDLLNDLWNWKVTARRGCGFVAPVISREEEASKGLLLLGNGVGEAEVNDLLNDLWNWKVTARRGRGFVAPVISREEEASNGLLLLGNGVGEAEQLERGCSNEKAILLHGKSIVQEENEPNYENTNTKEVVTKRRRKKLKLSDLTMEQNAEDKYKCVTCGKSFATFQALGGHRSSHSTKSKIINQKPVLYLTAPGEKTENNGALVLWKPQ